MYNNRFELSWYKVVLDTSSQLQVSQIKHSSSTYAYPHSLTRGSATFLLKGQITNILGFGGHTVLVATNQHFRCREKAAIDNTCVHGCGSIPIKLY